MISVETKERVVLRLILACGVFYPALRVNAAADNCDINKKLYTEIGCAPVHGKDSSNNNCPVAYDCEHIFKRPEDKCYFNGNVYEPSARLSKTDLASINPCLAACYCDQRSYKNKTITKFNCANVQCPSYYNRLAEPCYYQYDKDSCCEVNTYCPDEKTVVHKCSYQANIFKKGQQMYNLRDEFLCVCSESFNGTFNDESCRKLSCKSELRDMENILKRSAPIYYEKADGCPIEWYHAEDDVVSATTLVTSQFATGDHVCKYGNLSIPLGQTITIGGKQSDSSTYKTVCSCSVPPLITCIKTRLH